MEREDFITRLEAAKKKKQESVNQVVAELKSMYEKDTGKEANYVFVL